MAVTSMTFDESYYLEQNPDVLTGVLNGWFASAEAHFQAHGYKELRDPNSAFDTSYYLAQNPDVLSAGVNPFDHFIAHGASENRAPTSALEGVGANFDSATYLATYTDVQAAITAGTFTSAYQHWVLFGQYETRTAQTLDGTTLTGAGSTGSTFTLTTGIDTVTGTSSNDTIVGVVDAAATSNTLSLSDQISGGLGTDTLQVLLANSGAGVGTGASFQATGVEVLTLNARSNDTAAINLANATSITAIQIHGLSDVAVYGMGNGRNVSFSGAYTNTATLALGSDTTADTVTLTFNDASSAGLRAGNSATGFEVVNLVANAAFHNDSVFDFGAASALNVSGTANVVLNFQAGSGNHGVFTGTGAQATGVESFQNISASGLAGNLTFLIGTAGVDMTIVGGAGNDTFYASAGFNQSDSLDGGAGTDTLNWVIGATGTYRPVLSNVETLTVDLNADAIVDLRNSGATSISTLNVLGVATASTFSALSSAVTTINLYSGASAGGATFNYATAGTSDVTLNLSNQATATSTGSYTFGDVAVANNTGTLTVVTNGSATGQALDGLVANSVSGLVVDVTTGQLTLGTALAANAAKSVTFNINNGETATLQNVNASSVTALTVNLSGASAVGTFSAVNIGGAGGGVNLNLLDGTGTLTIGALNAGTTASTAAMSNTLNVSNAGSGTVTLNALDLTTGAATAGSAGQVTLAANVNQVGSGASFQLNAIDLGHIETASLSFTLSGQGTFLLSAGATLSATTGQVLINSTAVTGGQLTANFSAFADTNVTFDVRLGNHSATVALGAGNDVVQFGLGSGQFVRGGAGDDQFTMNNTAVSIVQYNNTATGAANQDNGVDTVFGASTGDIILFNGLLSASNDTAKFTAGITTGATAAVNSGAGMRTATFTGVTTAVYGSAAAGDFFAMYTAAGDMVIEVLLSSAGVSGQTIQTGEITKFVLNGKGDVARSALIRVDSNGTGLAFTLV